jgi:hypothetical protein
MIIWLGTLVIVPICTYRLLGVYVSSRMQSGREFSLWGGLLEFHPINMKGKTSDDILHAVLEVVEDDE